MAKLYDDLTTPYPIHYLKSLKPTEIWLAERCCQENDGPWWVRQQDGHWENMRSKKAAMNSMEHNWLGGPHHVNDGDIIAFMKDQAPVVQGAIMVPTSSAQIVRVGESVYINTWKNTLALPEPDALNDLFLRPVLTLVLRMMREALCNKSDAKSLEDMLTIAASNDPNELEFRTLMSFLAAGIQQPGINLMINIWLIGAVEGVGKGTLMTLLTRVYGRKHVLQMSGAEVEKGGWTDGLEGKLLVVLNEIYPDGRFDWEGFIKQNSVEEVIQIRKRNHHSFPVINFANWIFTTNKENPACFGPNDRRNFLIATTTDEEKAKLSVELNDWMADNPDQIDRLVGGFVAIMHRHKVDKKLLSRAGETAIKKDVQEETAKESDMDYWLRYDRAYPRDTWVYASDLIGPYTNYMRSKQEPEIRKFAGALGKLARHGKIKRVRTYKNSPWQYMIEAAKYPATDPKPSANTNIVVLKPKGRG